MYAALTACYLIPCQTHYVYLITYSKFRFWPFLARNASKRPEIDGIAKQTQDYLLA
jgi:hypothetical protein